MPKKISILAAEKVPALPARISLFQSKLQIAHYAQGSITDYCHALYKAVVHIIKAKKTIKRNNHHNLFCEI